jgi:tetratricopeptide (TPR) repeat protein
MRRGATNCQLEFFSEALHDYKIARTLADDENNLNLTSLPSGVTLESLRSDVVRLEKLVLADGLKKEADKILSEGQLEAAKEKYTEALRVIPVHVSCLSNRSACKLAMGDFSGCVEDCTAALTLLQADLRLLGGGKTSQNQYQDPNPNKNKLFLRGDTSQGSADGALSMLSSILPAPGSDKRKSWVLRTILRRGAAYAQLSQLAEAVDDYKTASGLDPTNETLKSDLNKILNLREGKRAQSD